MHQSIRVFVVAWISVWATGGYWTIGRFEAQGAELKAGVARVDVTPPLEMHCPLGGYGERMNRPAEGVHDRVFAKALVVTDGTRKFALVTADVLGFPPPVKPALLRLLADDGWTNEQVMLLASHSHTSIEMNAINPANTFGVPQIGIHNPRVFDFLMKRLVQVVQDANQHLAPVAIGTSRIAIDGWNRNRRGRGPTDNELTVTRVDALDGKPLAVLVNFTAHPTFMSGEDMLFSGGWPGHMQRTLESLIGPGVTAMYYNGAEGDQSPVGRPDAGGRWERAERYGRDLGIVAWKQWQRTTPHKNTSLAYHAHTIALPERTWHPEFAKTGGAEYGLSESLLKEMLPRMFPAEVDSVSLRLGDLLIVGVPGEMAASLGLKIKAEASRVTGAKHPVIGGLADAWISYMLPADEYRRGGYESSVSFYGETLGEVIVAGALAGVAEMPR